LEDIGQSALKGCYPLNSPAKGPHGRWEGRRQNST